MIMEQVNILITYLKQSKLLDGLLSVVTEHSFMDNGTLKTLITKGLDSYIPRMRQNLPMFNIYNASEQLIGLLLNDDKIYLKKLQDLCGIAAKEGSEVSNLERQMTFGDNDNALPTLKIELRNYLVKLGFDQWIQSKKNFIMIKLKSKKDSAQLQERQIDIIKHDDFMELVRELIQDNKIRSVDLPIEINEILKKAQMSAMKPDILLLSMLVDIIKN